MRHIEAHLTKSVLWRLGNDKDKEDSTEKGGRKMEMRN